MAVRRPLVQRLHSVAKPARLGVRRQGPPRHRFGCLFLGHRCMQRGKTASPPAFVPPYGAALPPDSKTGKPRRVVECARRSPGRRRAVHFGWQHSHFVTAGGFRFRQEPLQYGPVGSDGGRPPRTHLEADRLSIHAAVALMMGAGRKVRTPPGRKSRGNLGYHGPDAVGRKVPQKTYRLAAPRERRGKGEKVG